MGDEPNIKNDLISKPESNSDEAHCKCSDEIETEELERVNGGMAVSLLAFKSLGKKP